MDWDFFCTEASFTDQKNLIRHTCYCWPNLMTKTFRIEVMCGYHCSHALSCSFSYDRVMCHWKFGCIPNVKYHSSNSEHMYNTYHQEYMTKSVQLLYKLQDSISTTLCHSILLDCGLLNTPTKGMKVDTKNRPCCEKWLREGHWTRLKWETWDDRLKTLTRMTCINAPLLESPQFQMVRFPTCGAFVASLAKNKEDGNRSHELWTSIEYNYNYHDIMWPKCCLYIGVVHCWSHTCDTNVYIVWSSVSQQ